MSTPLGIAEEIVEPGHLRWTLCRPSRRNAVDPPTLRFIAERARTLRGEIVVLAGEGDQAFCSGFDLGALARVAEGMPDRPLIEATSAIGEADATFIAEIGGATVGAGVELAAACDLRFARTGVRFRVPAGELGVVYHAEGLERIQSMFGPALTRRLLLLGETITAEEALGAGGLLAVLPDTSSLGMAARECARKLRSMAPLSLRGNRDALRTLGRGTLDPSFVTEHERRRAAAYDSADHQEARLALAEGRPPRFRGA